MIRLHLLFALLSFVLVFAGPDGYAPWGWWGSAAYLVGAVLSSGVWALGLIARIRFLERYDRLEPQFARAAEALSVASVFIPFLRAANAVLAGLAFGSWLLSRRRSAQGLVFLVEALIAFGGPLCWLLLGGRPTASSNWLVAAVPLVAMALVFFTRNGGFRPRPSMRRPRLRQPGAGR